MDEHVKKQNHSRSRDEFSGSLEEESKMGCYYMLFVINLRLLIT